MEAPVIAILSVLGLTLLNASKTAELHLFALSLKEKYGLNINPKLVDSLDYFSCGPYCFISKMNRNHGNYIAIPLDEKQPEEGEILVALSFPTGGYMFNKHISDRMHAEYPTEFFNKFINEIRSYNPDYSDIVNHSFYWKLENAKDIFNEFPSILEKYESEYDLDCKERKIKRLEKQLKELKDK